MGEEHNDKKPTAPTPPAGEPKKGRGGCRGGQNRQQWNNNAAIWSTGNSKEKYQASNMIFWQYRGSDAAIAPLST